MAAWSSTARADARFARSLRVPRPRSYPDCKVELNLSDKSVDLIADNMHLPFALAGRQIRACMPAGVVSDFNPVAYGYNLSP